MIANPPSGAVAVPRRLIGRPGLVLAITSIVLAVMGLVMILSASSIEAYRKYGSSFLFFYRQAIGFVIGLALMAILARVDHTKLRRWARPFMGLSVIGLFAVLIPGIGSTRGGSSRWLIAGPISIQPSEMAKLALIIFCAHVLDLKGRKILEGREMAVPILPATGLVCLLVIAQPDLGTTVICASCVFIVLYLAGARFRHLAMLASAGFVAVAVLALTEGYRRARVFSFLNPWADPLNTGYHTIQGQIALGSGGWFGVGLGASRQKWSYVPNAHTDFIFAILGEELGLAGTLFVLVMFALVIYLGIRIARAAPDRFGTLVAGGITGWLGIQALINIGAVSGLLPITGVPLPLISYGGSSLVFSMAGIGILLSVARRSRF